MLGGRKLNSSMTNSYDPPNESKSGTATRGEDGRARLLRVTDDFIAFIYAAGVSVFLDNAHDGKLFDNPWLTLCVAVSIFLFAQDWLGRFGGFRRVQGVTPIRFYLKSILDVGVVICLCLIILDAIGQMTNMREGGVSTAAITQSLYYKLSLFALFSGVWNIVVIYTDVAGDRKIDRSNIASFLLRGHVGDEILDKFPRVGTSLGGMKTWLSKYHSDTRPRDETESPLRHISRTLWSFLCYLFKKAIIGPILIVPFSATCWIGLHLLILNLFLGLLIGLSSFKLEGAQLTSALGEGLNVSPLWFALILLGIVWISHVFRTLYYSARIRSSWLEALGYWFFLAFLFVFYARLPVGWLALVLILQQIAANIFIFSFFMVPADKKVSVIDKK